MLRKFTNQGFRISVMLLLILGVVAGSLVTDAPFPTKEVEAGLYHHCCIVECEWEDGRWVCRPVCRVIIHWRWWGHSNPC